MTKPREYARPSFPFLSGYDNDDTNVHVTSSDDPRPYYKAVRDQRVAADAEYWRMPMVPVTDARGRVLEGREEAGFK